MDSLDYPVGAVRLRNSEHLPDKVTVSVPHPSPPSLKRSQPPAPALSAIPQLLLSASLPSLTQTATGPSSLSGPIIFNPRKKLEPLDLISSRDPLSLPIMTNNFKRFVMIVGPVFWLQDRIEEIVLWKRGGLWTTTWMAAYSLFCFYPRLILLLPHIILIGAILATYPYPSNPTTNPLYAPEPQLPPAAPPVESAAPWQANIQAIQNLMGAYADFHAIVEPYLHHFYLTPAHFSAARQFPTSPSTSSYQHSPSRSHYTPHILALIVLSFFPLLFVLHLPWFPLRSICILAGWIPLLFTHPYTQAVIPVLRPALLELLPLLTKQIVIFNEKISHFLSHYFGINLTMCRAPAAAQAGPIPAPSKPISMIVQRFIDDDRLTDACWNSEMREVELWENERYGGTMPPPLLDGQSSLGGGSTSAMAIAASVRKGWGKQNLKSGERGPWSRSRDGSNEVALFGSGSAVETSGEVSNLTFSLAPGWSFVESEDWRKDVQCAWSGWGCDEDGWVYTNDAWLGPRPAPYTSGGGSVTRRRRWTRRVWYDPRKAEEDHR